MPVVALVGERASLEDMVSGMAKIAAGALLPHKIAASMYPVEDDHVLEM
jgi:hypothetical protein